MTLSPRRWWSIAPAVVGMIAAGCASAPPAMRAGAAPAAPAAAVAPAAAAAPRAAQSSAGSAKDGALDQELIRQGYKVRVRNGVTLYCRAEAITGTRFRSTLCRTAEEIADAQKDGQNTVKNNGRAVHCLGPECS